MENDWEIAKAIDYPDGWRLVLYRTSGYLCKIVLLDNGKLQATEEFCCPHSASKRFDILDQLCK